MSEVRIKEVAPIRNMGIWLIWAIGVGSVVGDGVFLLIGDGISKAGPSSLIVYFVAGIVQAATMIGLGELAVGIPSGGAQSVWVEKFMGRGLGLLSGLAGAAGWLVLMGALSLALGTFTCWYFPSLNQDVWTILFALIFLTLLTLLNIAGAAVAAKTQLGLVLVLVSIMVLFGVLGLKHIDPSNYTPFMPFGVDGALAAFPSGIYVYMGAVALCTAGSECRKSTDLGKGLVLSSATFIIIYTIGMAVVIGTVSHDAISMDVSPYTVAAEIIFGYWGGFVLNTAAWIATATSLLMGVIYVPSRMFYQMGKTGYLPAFFGELNEKTRTPVKGLVFGWAVGVVTILIGIFNVDFVYVFLTSQATIMWIVSWCLALIAAFYYRKDMKIKGLDVKKTIGWKQPLFPICPIIGLFGCGYTLYLSITGSIGQFLASFIWIFAYIIYYHFYVKKKNLPALE
ncbi:MAG: APC family permease [Eubacteriales bacterium]|nr:APC family permease [Eubacteriales bacterium]